MEAATYDDRTFDLWEAYLLKRHESAKKDNNY